MTRLPGTIFVFALAGVRTALAVCGADCVLVNDASDTTHASCDVAGVGTCSLRDAFIRDPNTIQFAIGSGHQTITLWSDLPDIIGANIDGTTQPGYAGVPLIELTRAELP